MSTFYKLFENYNLEQLISAIASNPADEELRYVFSDYLEEKGDILSAKILRGSEDSIFVGIKYIAIGDEDVTPEDDRSYYDWSGLIGEMKKYNELNRYPITKDNAKRIWLLRHKTDYRTGYEFEETFRAHLRTGGGIPSIIMYILLKSAGLVK